MQIPDIPDNESSRLEALRSTKILDTAPEERFDRLTRLAKRLFDVPIALVSLVDENRQWFKSCIGLDASETSREISFCGHAIHGDELFIISNALEDERFADNPLVQGDPNIRFYAGCPLKYDNGIRLGTLCIIDSKPREFTKEDLAALEDLAELAATELMAVQLATLDELTGVNNRRGFIKLADHYLSLCAREKLPASLIFFDLDGLKRINDTYGHAEGDHAIKIFANELQRVYRSSDIIGRFGGDEFVVLLTNAPVDFSEKIVARLRKNIERYNRSSSQGYKISFSEGLVDINHGDMLSIVAILDAADMLMYQKKRAID